MESNIHDNSRSFLGKFSPKGDMSLNNETKSIKIAIQMGPAEAEHWTMAMNVFDSSKFFHKIVGRSWLHFSVLITASQ